jgi:hypothetical protein
MTMQETMPEMTIRRSKSTHREMQKHTPELTRRIMERAGSIF